MKNKKEYNFARLQKAWEKKYGRDIIYSVINSASYKNSFRSEEQEIEEIYALNSGWENILNFLKK